MALAIFSPGIQTLCQKAEPSCPLIWSIHVGIFWGSTAGSPRVDMDDVTISDAEPVEIYGVTVMTLPMDKTFVQLVLHHYKDGGQLQLLAEHNYIRRNLFHRSIFSREKKSKDLFSSSR
ncbi:MAG: hypothetical protein ACLR23_15470 [Clostridia bacterium]